MSTTNKVGGFLKESASSYGERAVSSIQKRNNDNNE